MMKNNSIIIYIALSLLNINSICAQDEIITKNNLKENLAHFLVKSQRLESFKSYRENEDLVWLSGIFNDSIPEGELSSGLYSFGVNRTHDLMFFVLIKKNGYKILNITSKKRLLNSITTIINYCERNKICSDVTKEYVGFMINIYYKVNLNPNRRKDENCTNGSDRKKLP